MKTMSRSKILSTSLIAGGTCWLLLGYAVAGPVVQPADQPATQSTQTGQSADSQSWVGQTEDEQKKTSRTTSTQRAATSAPAAAGQPTTAFTPDPRTMPLPPTYAPGAPGGPTQTANPYGTMPSPPTAYGPYGSAAPGAASSGYNTGAAGTGSTWGGAAAPMGYSTPSGGGAGYGVPPSPTQPMSLGGAAMSDPSFGRYESMNMREATGVRQPATIGDSQARVLQGGKPFSGWQPSNAYSPYMRLNDFANYQSPGTNVYYNYVKPLLDQNEQNRAVTRDVQGLTDTARAGYQAMQAVGQRPGNTAPTTAPRVPATFMNTGQYYPDPNAR
jgi:hypothetical protein